MARIKFEAPGGRATDSIHVCRECRQPFVLTLYELRRRRRLAAARGWGDCTPSRCAPCRRLRRGDARDGDSVILPTEADIVLVCDTCRAEFRFSPDAQREYHASGWTRPRRCKRCRLPLEKASAMSGAPGPS